MDNTPPTTSESAEPAQAQAPNPLTAHHKFSPAELGDNPNVEKASESGKVEILSLNDEAHPYLGQQPAQLLTHDHLASVGANAPIVQPTFEVDEDYDGSSTFDFSDSSSFVSSLSSKITDYQWDNGRRYHAYKEGHYPLPNDETELDREDMKHHMMMLITNGRLHHAPIPSKPTKILDLGTGTGIWAIQVAEEYPSAEVIGTDLSPIQPEWIPPNCIFEVDDLEKEWLWASDSFDLVHVRFMFLAIRDYPKMLKEAMRVIKPGGYFEIAELYFFPESPDNSIPENSQVVAFLTYLTEAAAMMGFDLKVSKRFKDLVIDAGYEEVTEETIIIPWSSWPKDPRLKAVGTFQVAQLRQGLQGICMKLFTKFLGWTPAEVEVFLVGVRRELDDRSIHMTNEARVVYGRKPLHSV